jgi:hypothetical protein
MAARTVVEEQAPSTAGITGEGRHLRQPFTAHVLARRNSARDERQIRDDVLHLSAAGRQLRAREAPREAIVDSILDRYDRRAAIDEAWEPSDDADERRGPGPAFCVTPVVES